MVYYHSSYGRPKKKKNGFKKILWGFLIILLIASGGLGYFAYGVVFNPNVWAADGESVIVKIPTGSEIEDVKKILYENGIVIHRKNFEWVSNLKSFDQSVKPGNYEIKNGISNNDLINLLRSGNQKPINLIFNNVKDIYQLATKVSPQIEADSVSIVDYIVSEEFSKLVGDTSNLSVYFIPNTYEFYWNTSAEAFVLRMYEEYEEFWSGRRQSLAEAMDMSMQEVVILASIVEKETQQNSEKPVIAGVYINRINRKWLLQADPTLLYILDDNSIRRVLNVHKKIDSPYNTYKYLGLPPGPICVPSISSIDAVLNYNRTPYLYFCAKDDLSGYHSFAKTLKEHNRNAKKYQKALNELKIYK